MVKLIIGMSFFLFATLLFADDTRPNVLFLAVDDMNDWVGCLGNSPSALTPNLDKLAKRGVNFTNAHTAGVFCAPSRAAIFSGQFASTTGCYQTPNYFVHHPELVPLQVAFARAGYKTFGAGKLFHHPAGCIDTRGWDQFFLRREEQRTRGWPLNSWGYDSPFPDPFPSSVFNKGQPVNGGLFLEWGAIPNDREEEMADTHRANWAVRKLKEEHHTPFFLGLGIYAPHFPNYCPQKYYELYDNAQINLPPYKDDDLDDLPEKIRKQKLARSRIHKKLETLGAVKDAIEGYLACMSYADAMMGRVLNALANSPYADNTIVILWSDHGYHHGEKSDWGKHTLWERTSNVPFIWAGPGIAKGKATDATVSLIDMYPTLVDLCRLTLPPQNLEGHSLKRLLMKPDETQDRNILLPYLEPGQYAVINKRWRYICYAADGDELYDTQLDPNEWNNLAGDPQYAEQIARMRSHAPLSFAEHEPKLNFRKDLVLKGNSFHWEPGKGNAKPEQPYLPPQKQLTPAKGKNLIRNGSFEESAAISSTWSFHRDLYKPSQHRQTDGKLSLSSKPSRGMIGEKAVRQTVQLTRGHAYEASYRIFFEPGSEGKVVFDTFDKFDETAQVVMDASANRSWQVFTSRFSSGKHTEVTIRFFPTDGFTGRFFIDDVRLCDVTD